MSPLQPQRSPGGAILARIALRRVAVPVANPRVFQVFEQLHERALRKAPASPPPASAAADARP